MLLEAISHKMSTATKLHDRSHKKLSSVTELSGRFHRVENHWTKMMN